MMYGMAVGCFTERMLRSSISYHQKQALPVPLSQVSNIRSAACGSVFYVSTEFQVIICDLVVVHFPREMSVIYGPDTAIAR